MKILMLPLVTTWLTIINDGKQYFKSEKFTKSCWLFVTELWYCFIYTINDKNFQYCISIILRTRSELLNLKGKAFNSTSGTLRILCNLNEEENTYHFVGKCHIELSILVKIQ